MSEFLWWFGAIHVAGYLAWGLLWMVALGTVKLHMAFKVMSRILTWHVARARWQARDVHGLSDAEWQRGEPKP